jgi:outer membrane protein TolC
MTAIEKNTDYLLKNIETVLDKHIEFSNDAKDLQEAYTVSRACFDALVENVLEYVEAERSLIRENKKTCRAKLKAELKACE